MTEVKFCKRCELEKPIEEFSLQKGRWRQTICKECVRENSKAHYKANKEEYLEKQRTRRREKKEHIRNRSRWYHIKRTYGLTEDAYNSIRNEQDDKCYICERPQKRLRRPLCVDHDHRSGKIRGLLCDRCNRGIEHFKDNPLYFENAASYLRREVDYGTVPSKKKVTNG